MPDAQQESKNDAAIFAAEESILLSCDELRDISACLIFAIGPRPGPSPMFERFHVLLKKIDAEAERRLR